MIPVRLTPTRAGPTGWAGNGIRALEDTLWAHATPEHGPEHLRIRAVPAGIGAVVFILAATPHAARAAAAALAAGPPSGYHRHHLTVHH
ncbi:hypothetical protein [Kitasatospora sp. MBT63]|uniref:hypothetical protein n=1 Tax=Kitasatospora sp. MBT63 TaxID=1444768 RepID=UPI00069173C4|nr:hypothetical protein [Kitasatospora sp. MBT63]